MSLKAFHIVFIALSTLLAVGLAAWAVRAWMMGGGGAFLAMATLSLAAAVTLVVYGRWFLRKLAGVDFL